MTHDDLRRLPPPPLFTIRPPPKPPGSLFEHFQTVEILNGQCVRPSLHILNTTSSSSSILQTHEDQTNLLNLFLLILAIASVISCIIIAIFIFICLKKLRKEEKQYKNYMMTGSSISSRNHSHPHHSDLCTRASEHYKCTSTTLNCCDDYYSHQLIPMIQAPLPSAGLPTKQTVNSTNNIDSPSMVTSVGTVDNSQNHQYECIPECLLTMTRHHYHHHSSTACPHQHQLYHRPSACSVPYATFSRSLLLSQGVTTTSTSNSSQCTCSPPPSAATAVQEESSIPLLDSSIYKESHQNGENFAPQENSRMIGWTRRNSSTSTKRKSTGHTNNEQGHTFMSQLRKSSVLQ